MLKRGIPLFSCLAVALLLVSSSYAQQPTSQPPTAGEVLTNGDVVKMVEAKLGDDLIVSKIKSSPSNFDTSIDAILKLKAAGVSDAVIHVMVEASAATKVGLYWKPTQGADKRMVRLEPSTYSQGKMRNMLGSVLSMGISKTKWNIVIKGDRAALRIAEATPEFWFYFGTGQDTFSSGPSSQDDFLLVKLEKKGKDRELVVGEVGLYDVSTGTRSKDTLALESKQVAPGIYQVRSNSPLEPGEYAFMRAGVNIQNVSTGGKLFDFGIDRAK